MILRSGRFSSFSAAYSVVVLPEPVGPVTRKMPFGRLMILLEAVEVFFPEPEIANAYLRYFRGQVSA